MRVIRRGLWCVFFVSVVAQLQADERPYWSDSSYVPLNQGPHEFIGVSQLWLAVKDTSEQNALDEACERGLASVAEFFELSVATQNSASQTVVGDEFSGRYVRTIESVSKVKLLGVSPLESFAEKTQEGLYIQAFCLYSLDSRQIKNIEDARKEANSKIDELVDDVFFYIDQNKFGQAQLIVTRLRTDYEVSEEFASSLENLINEHKINAIDISVVLSDSIYTPGSTLALSLVSNLDSYVYVFKQTSDSVNLIFPSPLDSFNVLKGGQVKQLPTPSQIRNAGVIKVEKNLDKLIVVNSYSPLAMDFVSKSFNKFNVIDKTAFDNTLEACRHNKQCLVHASKIHVDQDDKKLSLGMLDVMVNGEPSAIAQSHAVSEIRELGFVIDKGKGPSLLISINETVVYSSLIKSEMTKLKVDWRLSFENGRKRDWRTKKTMSTKVDRKQLLESVIKGGRKALIRNYD